MKESRSSGAEGQGKKQRGTFASLHGQGAVGKVPA